MARTILSKTPGKTIRTGFRRERDRQEIVICFLAHGIKQASIEAERNKLIFVFDGEEVDVIEQKMLSGEDFNISWKRLQEANATWKNAIVMLKDTEKQHAK